MARRKKPSLLEDLMNLVALLPWWVGVTIAAIGYLVLHRLAAPAQLDAIEPAQVGHLVLRTYATALATVGQYAVPFVGLAGAVGSVVRRRRRAALLENVAHSKHANALDGMSWHEFEMLVGEAYRLQGYRVAETGDGGADGGVDVVLTKGGEKFFVQCKQWKAYKVGVEVVRELYGVMAAKGAAGGFLVTSGRFTDGAKAFADGRNVQLVDGPQLSAMIKKVKQSPPAKPSMAVAQAPVQTKVAAEPRCPQCGSSMVKRTARKGNNAGAEFWGCSRYPSCKGVRQLG